MTIEQPIKLSNGAIIYFEVDAEDLLKTQAKQAGSGSGGLEEVSPG